MLSDTNRNSRLIKQLQEYDHIFFQNLNIFKYSENLNEQIKQKDMIDNIEVASYESEENKSNIPSEDRNYVDNLYYKPEIMLYLLSLEKEQDISSFEELRILGLPTKINFREKVFAPISYLTDFWTMSSELKPVEINRDGISKIKVKLNFKFLTNFKIKYLKGIEFNSDLMEKTFQIPSSKDMFVELLKNNSMTYLTIMFTVNILHSLFSILGFASDISYYKNLKKLDGVYTKHLFFHLFQMFVAMLYVSIEGAHFIVKVELFIGLAIELWKLKKIFSISFKKAFPFISIKYKIEFQQKESEDYETEAVNLMVKYLFSPVAVIYLAYRIYYYKHRLTTGLFKFVIEYIFFLMNLFGFILLTPQIYLNYKLKSVEHLPLKALTFKFLNTIIDDLYAFAVKTPTLYRIFVFKDDVVFVIYICQIILYRNNKRINVVNDKKEIAEKNKRVLLRIVMKRKLIKITAKIKIT